jgi:hypothetical protein
VRYFTGQIDSVKAIPWRYLLAMNPGLPVRPGEAAAQAERHDLAREVEALRHGVAIEPVRLGLNPPVFAAGIVVEGLEEFRRAEARTDTGA